MFNYIKFALFQIFGFLLSIPELVKLKINEKKYTSIEKFKFIKSHAKKSLDLVKKLIKNNALDFFLFEEEIVDTEKIIKSLVA